MTHKVSLKKLYLHKTNVVKLIKIIKRASSMSLLLSRRHEVRKYLAFTEDL